MTAEMFNQEHRQWCSVMALARAKFNTQLDSWSDNESKWRWVLKSKMASEAERIQARDWLKAHKRP